MFEDVAGEDEVERSRLFGRPGDVEARRLMVEGVAIVEARFQERGALGLVGNADSANGFESREVGQREGEAEDLEAEHMQEGSQADGGPALRARGIVALKAFRRRFVGGAANIALERHGRFIVA